MTCFSLRGYPGPLILLVGRSACFISLSVSPFACFYVFLCYMFLSDCFHTITWGILAFLAHVLSAMFLFLEVIRDGRANGTGTEGRKPIAICRPCINSSKHT